MPRITIDGQELGFDGKKLILDIAQENGVAIPHYCYHPGLSVVASCRICLAEVAQPNPRNPEQVQLLPKLVPTCQTLAVDGMEVYTKSPKAIANQKSVMEYLLINHPLDCPVCDQAGECSLQDYSYRYGRAESRFDEAKVKQPKKDIGPGVYLYADRCIMCSRCVRFTREITGTGEIGIFGRGHTEQIDVFPGKPLDNEMAGNVVDLCPVGALLDKDFLFEQRVWLLTSTASIDGITASGDNIWIDHNEGQVYRVKPRTNEAVNKWWISDEIRYGWKFVHSDERLKSPMRRQYGVSNHCDWDRAYRDVADHFKRIVSEQGEGSLGVIVSPMVACEEAYLLGQFIRQVDPKAVLGVGAIPVEGQDKTYPGGYTIRSEKCPNSQGVRRALELVSGDQAVLTYDEFLATLGDKGAGIGGVLLVGGYPSQWVEQGLTKALGKKFTVLIDTLANDLVSKADVVLPGATWVEKAGCFQNVNGRIQGFEQAIGLTEFARSEGQIALDLMAACGLGKNTIYDAQWVRSKMGGVFETGVEQPPAAPVKQESQMQYVEL